MQAPDRVCCPTHGRTSVGKRGGYTLLVALGNCPVASGAWVVSHASRNFLLTVMRAAPSSGVLGLIALLWSSDMTLHAPGERSVKLWVHL